MIGKPITNLVGAFAKRIGALPFVVPQRRVQKIENMNSGMRPKSLNRLLSSPRFVQNRKLSVFSFVEKDAFYKKRAYLSLMVLPTTRSGLPAFTPRYSHTKSHSFVSVG